MDFGNSVVANLNLYWDKRFIEMQPGENLCDFSSMNLDIAKNGLHSLKECKNDRNHIARFGFWDIYKMQRMTIKVLCI